jgi:hypothetical protein
MQRKIFLYIALIAGILIIQCAKRPKKVNEAGNEIYIPKNTTIDTANITNNDSTAISPLPNNNIKNDTIALTKAKPNALDANKQTTVTNNTVDIQGMAKELCDCMKPIENELKPEDKAHIEMMMGKMNKDLMKDSVAMKKFQKENQADIMKMGFIMMRLQKYFAKGSATTICSKAIDEKYGTEKTKPTKEQTALLADALQQNGCIFMATMMKISGEKM